MKVALIRPPEVSVYWHTTRPSLGVGYITSFLHSNGIECKIFDANFNSWTEEKTIEKVVDYNPDLVGLSAMTHEVCAAHNLATKLKSRLDDIAVVIGGCHITALPQQTLDEFQGFTYGVYGEGEKTMLELINCFQQGDTINLSGINGLVYRDNLHKIKVNAPRERLSSSEFNDLPYPAYNQYYKDKGALAGKNDYYVMMTSRGCPYDCAFCMQVLGKQVRRRSTENIVNEMEYAVEQYGAHTIHFLDDLFLFNNQLTFDTLDLIIEHGLQKRVRWRGLTRVNFVDESLMKRAKEAGCFAIEMGLESGSDKILKAINKNITVKEIESAVRIIKKSGIFVEANFILGHPNETTETVKATINLASRLNTNTVAIGIMTPYPGTKVYELAKRGECDYRLLTEDWTRYDKYGGNALELNSLPLKELEKWQKKGLLWFYIRNLRILDLMRFTMKYRMAIINLILKQLRKGQGAYEHSNN